MDNKIYLEKQRIMGRDPKEFLKEAEERIRLRDRAYIDKLKSINSDTNLMYSLGGLLINIGVIEDDQSLIKEGTAFLLDNIRILSKDKDIAAGAYYNLANGFNALFDFKIRKNPSYALFGITELEQAKANYLKAIQSVTRPKSMLLSQIWVNLGNLYFQIGRVVDALDCYDAAISCVADHGMALVNKGRALYYFAGYSGKQKLPFAREAHRLIKRGLDLGINEEAVSYFKQFLAKIENHFKDQEWLEKERTDIGIQINAENGFERFLMAFCLKNRL
jgi:tetratricopeptide (TPR) repeat protein